jgi:hypothetical protein
MESRRSHAAGSCQGFRPRFSYPDMRRAWHPNHPVNDGQNAGGPTSWSYQTGFKTRPLRGAHRLTRLEPPME